MAQVKDLTQLTLRDLWREVKDEEDWWGDLKQETLRVVKGLLEGALEVELVEHLRAGRYRRGPLRRGYRNGYYRRSLLTELGWIERLRVPREREGQFRPSVIPRYQRRQEEVNRLVREMFLRGVSTRQVQEVVKPLLGDGISPQTVSRITRVLDEEVRRFHRRPLGDHYQYLFLDGITLKVRGALGAHKRLVLCAYGISLEGRRELMAFRQATTESEAQWEAFLRDLYQRGMEGKPLHLITTDGCPGLHRALDMVYPYVPRQSRLAGLGAQAKERGGQASPPTPGGLLEGCEGGVSGPHPTGGGGPLPPVGGGVAEGSPQSGSLLRGRPGGTAHLPGLSPSPLEEGAHHQRHRAGL